MPAVWFVLKRSLHCKCEPSDVHDPKGRGHLNNLLGRKAGRRSGCSRSIANLRDVIHGSKRQLERPPSCSPRSIGSSEFLNPIAHEVVLSESRCELRIIGSSASCHEGGSTYVGTLRPGTPGPGGGHPAGLVWRRGGGATPPRKCPSLLMGETEREGCRLGSNSSPLVGGVFDRGGGTRASLNVVACHRCGELFGKLEALEVHHLSKHAVTELLEGDSSRKIVEIICKASWLKSESTCGRIERILKVHNTQKTLAHFEEYRETVKIKASKLPKKHPRCMADGNELLRFYGTTIACSLGANCSSSLCTLEKCNVCRIIRHGFSSEKEVKGAIGVFTTSTSGRAYESIEIYDDDPFMKKALLVCRVIAGRVHKPLDNYQALMNQSGFDSLAGKMGLYSNIEELYLLNSRALLPCFVVICKL